MFLSELHGPGRPAAGESRGGHPGVRSITLYCEYVSTGITPAESRWQLQIQGANDYEFWQIKCDAGLAVPDTQTASATRGHAMQSHAQRLGRRLGGGGALEYDVHGRCTLTGRAFGARQPGAGGGARRGAGRGAGAAVLNDAAANSAT